MTVSDWIYIICTFCLVVTALTAPYINDLLKRKSLSPKLNIIFHKNSPYIIERRGDTLYFVCFEAKNKGSSTAKNCEVVVEEFWYKNEEGNLVEDKKNFPAKLLWTAIKDSLPIDILPKAGKFFNIFRISSSIETGTLFFTMFTDRLVAYAVSRITVSLNYLKIKIVVYSENAKKCEQYIEIKSPGIWREKKEQNLQEIQIILS